MIRMMTLTMLASASLVAACSKAAPPASYNTTLSTKEVMNRVINPAAVALWDNSGTIETLKGTTSKLPTTDDAWTAVENDAAIVAEGGNLMLLPGRVRKLDPKDEDWTKFTHQMIDLALAEKQAVAARDGDKMFNVGAKLYDDGCTACHQKYLIPFLPKT